MLSFRKQWTHVLYTPIPSTISPSSVIEFLHDPSAMMNLSPLVTRHEKLNETEPGSGLPLYRVYERIPILPFNLASTEISVPNTFEMKEDGVLRKTQAPLGFTSEALLEVVKAEDEKLRLTSMDETKSVVDANGEDIREGWILKETITSEVNVVFYRYVDSQLLPTRRTIDERLIQAVEKGDWKS